MYFIYYNILYLDGLNDIEAFKASNTSILTLEQKEDASEKNHWKNGLSIKEFSEIISIVLK